MSKSTDTRGDSRPAAGGAAQAPRLKLAVLGQAASPHDANRTAVFARRGHDVAMLSLSDGALEGVRVEKIPGRGIGFRPLRQLVLMGGIVRAILRERPDVWHAHYAAEYGTWAAALLRRHPLVITVMGGDVLFDEQGAQGRMGRALTRFALRSADLVLVKSHALGDVVASFGVDRSRILRVIWGIDLARFRPDPVEVDRLRAQWSAAGRTVLLAPRVLQEFYNHHLLIDALPALVAAGHDPIVVFAMRNAEPAYTARITEQARALGVADRLRFSPARPPEAMASLYAASDIVVSLAPSDGLPQTPIEAGAVERPTVMTDLPRYAELFTDGEDIVLTPLEPAGIAQRIAALMASRELREHISRGAGRLMREHAELSSEAARVEAEYRRLIDARRGRS